MTDEGKIQVILNLPDDLTNMSSVEMKKLNWVKMKNLSQNVNQCKSEHWRVIKDPNPLGK